jgi:hypothetical protein
MGCKKHNDAPCKGASFHVPSLGEEVCRVRTLGVGREGCCLAEAEQGAWSVVIVEVALHDFPPGQQILLLVSGVVDGLDQRSCGWRMSFILGAAVGLNPALS